MPARKEPPMVAFESSQGHHTYQFIRRTGEFVVNIPDASMVNQVLSCGRVSGKTGIDKYVAFRLTRGDSKRVKPPQVAEAFANLECKVSHVVDMGASAIVVGQVVRAVVDERHFVDGKLIFDNGLKLLHHMGGDRFCTSSEGILGKKISVPG